jgi:hypothetical protein
MALKQPALSLVNYDDCSHHASAVNFSLIVLPSYKIVKGIASTYDQFANRYNYLKNSSKVISRYLKHKFAYIQQQQLKLPYNTKGSRFNDHHTVYNEGEKP